MSDKIRITILLAVLAVAVGIIVAGTGGCSNRSPAGNDDADKFTQVPLKSIWATGGQKELKWLDETDERFRVHFEVLNKQSMGASEIFLARGDDIESALKATRSVFVGSHSVHGPASWHEDADLKSDQYWLVAYLGKGGAWRVKSAEVGGQRLRLRTISADTDNPGWPYFFWVPVGKLAPGTYVLELFEDDQREPILVRRVKVVSPR